MNKPWTRTCGPGVPREIDADAHPSTIALFDRAVAQYADRPAFECFGRTMTYAEVPKQIHFLDALPKSNIGKILRRDLRNMALA
jgi:long-chain acyl-CoA synthetase